MEKKGMYDYVCGMFLEEWKRWVVYICVLIKWREETGSKTEGCIAC